ncbi:hypothetical protein TRVL_02398 [Trypanosoma vivax]|nr:hypothetical protein TRVL_02398 [Trypanosoma vivax]
MTIATILAKLDQQSKRIEKLETAMKTRPVYHTRFDVLVMSGVSTGLCCEETVGQLRNTVEHTELITKVKIDYNDRSMSIALEEPRTELGFLGLQLRADCITNFHLLVKEGKHSVVIDTNTEKITDVTRVTLNARSSMATRELYEALRNMTQPRRTREEDDSPLLENGFQTPSSMASSLGTQDATAPPLQRHSTKQWVSFSPPQPTGGVGPCRALNLTE